MGNGTINGNYNLNPVNQTATSPGNPVINPGTPVAMGQQDFLEVAAAPTTSPQFVGDVMNKTLVDRIEELNRILYAEEFQTMLQENLAEFDRNLEAAEDKRFIEIQTALAALSEPRNEMNDSSVDNVIQLLESIQGDYNSEHDSNLSIAEVLQISEQRTVSQTQANALDVQVPFTEDGFTSITVQPYNSLLNVIKAIIGEEEDINNLSDSALIDKIRDGAEEIRDIKNNVNSELLGSSRFIRLEGESNSLTFEELLIESVKGNPKTQALVGDNPVPSLNIGLPNLFENSPLENSNGGEQAVNSTQQLNNVADATRTSGRPQWLISSLQILMDGGNPAVEAQNITGVDPDAVGFIEDAQDIVTGYIDDLDLSANTSLVRIREDLIQEYRVLTNNPGADEVNILAIAWQIKVLSDGENVMTNLVALANEEVTETELGLESTKDTVSSMLNDTGAENYDRVNAVLEAIDESEEEFRRSVIQAAPPTLFSEIESLYSTFFAAENTQDPLLAVFQWHVRTAENFLFQTAVSNAMQYAADTMVISQTTGQNPDAEGTHGINVARIVGASRTLVAELVQQKNNNLDSLRQQGLQILESSSRFISDAGRTAFQGPNGR